MAIDVRGVGALADSLRQLLGSHSTDVASCVVVASIDALPKQLVDVTDTDIESTWEQPMRTLIDNVVDAKKCGKKHLVVVVPTTAMSGGASYVLQSAVAEAARVFVKSAARQWGVDGVVVNCVAVSPDLFGIRSDVAGEVSLAPRALAEAPDALDLVGAIEFLCSGGAGAVTGQTLVVDGGLWM